VRRIAVLLVLLAAACAPVLPTAPAPAQVPAAGASAPQLATALATRNFEIAVAQVAPVAERICRVRRPGDNCDFLIVVDERRGVPANAFQTLDRTGRPVLGFTAALIADARNVDEIGFVIAHEAAHHIAGHIPRAQNNARLGAVLGGSVAAAMGITDPEGINTALRLGASVGARSYSKEFELEADALGTRIAAAAGLDPLRGALFFNRVPDPGDRFLGTHPPNADRMRTVARVAGEMQGE